MLSYAISDTEVVHCYMSLQRDETSYIAVEKTLDPRLAAGLGGKTSQKDLARFIPPYEGMPHPPPKTLGDMPRPGGKRARYNKGSPTCGGIWEAPFLANYTGGRGSTLNLTMCNWYLPQGPGVHAVHR